MRQWNDPPNFEIFSVVVSAKNVFPGSLDKLGCVFVRA